MTTIPVRRVGSTLLNLWHAALLALFVLSLGVGLARADDEKSCKGRDLRAELAISAPEAMEEVRATAAATPNGDARLWQLTAANGAVSYLYGTMHISDPEITRLGPEAQLAYDGAKVVVIETTDILDEQKTATAMWSRPELLAFTDGTSLLDHLDDEEERLLDGALREQGMTLSAMKSMKPWILAGSLALPACERGAARKGFLDIRLARDAQEQGREVAGLESAVEQMEAIASLPLEAHVDSLVDAARMGDRLDDVFATLGALYAEGQIGEIWPTLRALSEHVAGDGETLTEADENTLAAFDEAVITRRNHTMAERAMPLIEAGGAFIAVGALHLPGEEGLVELLRERGIAAERVAP